MLYENLSIKAKNDVTYEQFHRFIIDMDNEFPTPLSKRVDNLSDYSKKLLKMSHLCLYENDEKVVSVVAGYTENLIDNMAYISLVGTLPYARGGGSALP